MAREINQNEHDVRSGAVSETLASQDYGVTQRRLAFVTIAVLLCLGGAAAPFASLKLLQIDGFMSTFGALMFVIDLVTMILLLSQAQIDKTAGTDRLALAYLYSAAIVLPHIAAFPNALMPGTLIGGKGSAVWLWFFWHAGFASLVLFYVATAGRRSRPVGLLGIALTLGAVGLLTIVGTVGLPYLPPILANNSYAGPTMMVIGPIVAALHLAAFVVAVFRLRCRTLLHLWLTVSLMAACIDIALTLLATERFLLGWYLGRICSLLTGLFVLYALLREVTHLHVRLQRAKSQLEILAHLDGLTGLANRRAFDVALEREWRRCRRDRTPLSAMMIDVDQFKLFNDRYGHFAGDEALRRVGAQLGQALQRPADLACRYGGEEFALLLPGTGQQGAQMLAERVRNGVLDLAIRHEDTSLGALTISLGVASIVPADADDVSWTDLMRAADGALYEAKHAGRNTVRLAGEGWPAPSTPPDPARARLLDTRSTRAVV